MGQVVRGRDREAGRDGACDRFNGAPDHDTIDTAGLDTAGLDTAGHDTAGLDTAGLDTAGLDTAGHDTAGHDTADSAANHHADDLAADDDDVTRWGRGCLLTLLPKLLWDVVSPESRAAEVGVLVGRWLRSIIAPSRISIHLLSF